MDINITIFDNEPHEVGKKEHLPKLIRYISQKMIEQIKEDYTQNEFSLHIDGVHYNGTWEINNIF